MPSPISPDIIGGGREKFLLYGDPGMAKTFTSLTAPKPIYHLSVGGPNEVKTYFSKQFQEKFGWRLKPEELFTDWCAEEVDKKGRFKNAKAFDDACVLLDKALEMDDKGEIHFETIVIDNATVLTSYQMNKVTEIQNSMGSENSQGPPKKSTYDRFQQDGIMKLADMEWGAVQSLMEKFTSWLFSLDKNLVFIAHEWEQTKSNRAAQSQDVIAIKPLFVGKQRDRIANMFDNVWRMYKVGQLYAARTTPTDNPIPIIAKTRVGGILSDDYSGDGVNPIDLTKVIELFSKHAQTFKPKEPSTGARK